jgi:hypothetical protein
LILFFFLFQSIENLNAQLKTYSLRFFLLITD